LCDVEPAKQINDLLFQAEIFKVNLQGHSFEIIRQTFQPRESNSDTRALVSIPFQHLLTSNYDSALESAHSDSVGDNRHSHYHCRDCHYNDYVMLIA